MKKRIQIVASTLALVAMLSTAFPLGTYQTYAAENETKRYMVVAKDRANYNLLSKSVYAMDEEQPVYPEAYVKNNIVVMGLTEEQAYEMEKDSRVESIEEDIIVTASELDPEILYDGGDPVENEEGYTWNVKAIHADQEEYNMGGVSGSAVTFRNSGQNKVLVAVLDSGISDMGESNFQDTTNLVPGEEELLDIYADATGHGTGVSGIISAKKDGQGLIGVDPEATLMMVKVFNDSNQAPISRIIEGLQYAIDHNAKIINMSFGTTTDSAILHKKLIEWYQEGILFIAAAGNHGIAEFPGAYNEVVAVGATNTASEKSDFTAPGELMAPGEQIVSTGLLGGYAVNRGTSLAAPHVTGAASLLWSVDPTKSNQFIRALLKESARPIGNPDDCGAGLLDVSHAFEVYKEFEGIYLPDKQEYPEITTNDKELDAFDDVHYVENSWGAGVHGDTDLVNDKGFSTNEASTIVFTAKRIDSDKGIPKKDGMTGDVINGVPSFRFDPATHMVIHGGTTYKSYVLASNEDRDSNYVSDLRFVCYVAGYYLRGKVPDLNECYNRYPKVSSDMKTVVSNMINTNISSLHPAANEAYLRITGAKLLGIVVHLAGDTYAHRTMVDNNRPGDVSALSTAYFNEQAALHNDGQIIRYAYHEGKNNVPDKCTGDSFPCLRRGIALGVVECKDIDFFSMGGETRKEYEDSTDYIPQRLNATKATVSYLMTTMGKNKATDPNTAYGPSAIVFQPWKLDTESSYDFKLNGLYKYYVDTNFSNPQDVLSNSTDGLK